MSDKSIKIIFGKNFWISSAIAGLFIVSGVFWGISKFDIHNAETRIIVTIDYLKQQYNGYQKYNDTTEAKSMVRQNWTLQLVKDCPLDVKSEELKEWSDILWVTGISVLDSNGNLLAEYDGDGIGYNVIKKYLNNDTVLDCLKYSRKSYTRRILLVDESFVDVSMRQCASGNGIIILYRHVKKEFSEKSTLSIQSLLDGFNVEKNGTFIITRDSEIIASNDHKYVGCNVADNEVIQSIRSKFKANHLVEVKSKNIMQHYYGAYSYGHDFCIYAYFTEGQVYETTFHAVMIAVFIYILILIAVQIIRFHSTKKLVDRQEAQEAEYRKQLENKNKELMLAVKREESANKSKQDFLFNMSHDIRTPMNAIIGFTDLALIHINNREQVNNYLKKISVSSQHLLSLINDVLDMSRIESGKVKLEEKEVHLPELIHNLRDILQANVSSKNQSLFINTNNVTDEDIMADPLRLNQILLNILSNAIKFTPSGGTISLKIKELNSQDPEYGDYQFHIEDNGIGMSKEFQSHIFESFTREENSTVSGIQGTGLGMTITKNIVDLMGGDINLESTPGKGSKFVVSLKFKKIKSAPCIQKISYLEGLKALVVDDDTDTCLNISHMLRDVGMRSEWTTTGKEAIIRAQEAFNQKDVFKAYIIDYLISDMNGIEIIRRIKKYIGDSIPIIILTAYDWTDIEEEAKEAGVTSFCAKPIFLSDLTKVLAEPFTEKKDSIKLLESNYDFRDKRILLVEDNELNMEIAVTVLQSQGFKIDTAENGKVAVDKIIEQSGDFYDLVLMDIQMPVMDGYEAARQIRLLNDDKKSKLPIHP